jgi:PilZ domain-containing protein
MKPASFSKLVSQVNRGPESHVRRERYVRADPRYETASAVLVTNLTQVTEQVQGWLLDVSITGMRIDAALPFGIGDAVRVDLQNFMILGEVIHVTSVSETVEVGLKLIHSLDCAQLDDLLKSQWAELSRPDERPQPKAVAARVAHYAPDG